MSVVGNDGASPRLEYLALDGLEAERERSLFHASVNDSVSDYRYFYCEMSLKTVSLVSWKTVRYIEDRAGQVVSKKTRVGPRVGLITKTRIGGRERYILIPALVDGPK